MVPPLMTFDMSCLLMAMLGATIDAYVSRDDLGLLEHGP